MLTQDKGWPYLEYREDGSWEGIKICGWCFILKIESRESNKKKKKAVRDEKLSCSPVIPCNLREQQLLHPETISQ